MFCAQRLFDIRYKNKLQASAFVRVIPWKTFALLTQVTDVGTSCWLVYCCGYEFANKKKGKELPSLSVRISNIRIHLDKNQPLVGCMPITNIAYANRCMVRYFEPFRSVSSIFAHNSLTMVCIVLICCLFM